MMCDHSDDPWTTGPSGISPTEEVSGWPPITLKTFGRPILLSKTASRAMKKHGKAIKLLAQRQAQKLFDEAVDAYRS